MSQTPNDWNPHAPEIQADQVAAYDQMRQRCPVAYDPLLGYTIFRHQDIQTILHDPQSYSNRVSERHIAVPSGMDAPEHTAFRKINDKYYTPERMAAFEPTCRQVIRQLIAELPRNQPTEIMHHFARDYAVRIQNAFLGWRSDLEQPLNDWIEKNRRASQRRDPQETAQIALEFDGYIRSLLNERRQQPSNDITSELMHDIVELPSGSRTMTEAELISLTSSTTPSAVDANEQRSSATTLMDATDVTSDGPGDEAVGELKPGAPNESGADGSTSGAESESGRPRLAIGRRRRP